MFYYRRADQRIFLVACGSICCLQTSTGKNEGDNLIDSCLQGGIFNVVLSRLINRR